tara:strand:- start:96 stop:650 length:555 start_codon:yes stop_codon:yes gene_type:complete
VYNNIIHTIGFSRGWVPDVDNKKLKEIILKDPKPLEKNTKDKNYILTRHEDTQFPMNPEFKKILDHIRGQFKYLHNKNLRLMSFWSHIHEKNMSTLTHNHIEKEDYEGTKNLSGVYYVQVPEKSGHFVLHYPFNSHVTHQFPIMPKTGEFFLFSSAMDHHVTRNLSNELRISVSFNFKIEEAKQ